MNSNQRFRSIVVGTACLLSIAARVIAEDAFTSPRRGEHIENRREFSATTDVKKIDSSGKYWVALASVKGHEKDWERVLELHEKRNDKNGKADRDAELAKLLQKWEVDLFWPKYAVPKSPYQGRVFDGGQNPLNGVEPQPMIMVLLKVDDPLDKHFRKWFRDGSSGKGYPGISSSKLAKDMIIDRCEIFFP